MHLPNMRLLPALAWELGDDSAVVLDGRLIPLLKAVAETGSLAAAVVACGLCYRAAWGLLRDYQRLLGSPLVLLERGRGASLALTGTQLLAADAAARRRLAPLFQRLTLELTARADAKRAAVPRLKVAASHDLALAALRDVLDAENSLELDLSFMGSLDAIEQYFDRRVDVAGFHVPLTFHLPKERDAYLRRLRPRTDRLIQFVDREQGLIVPRNNPHRLKNLRDVVDRQLRFVNRQRGSGTRLLIDSLLEKDAIDVARVAGYATEEFTHAAVAATVASGGADVGFGVRAASAKYRLTFVPLARERYWLALRAAAVQSVPVTRLIQALQGPTFARIVKRLPGYFAIAAGAISHLDELGAPHARRR